MSDATDGGGLPRRKVLGLIAVAGASAGVLSAGAARVLLGVDPGTSSPAGNTGSNAATTASPEPTGSPDDEPTAEPSEDPDDEPDVDPSGDPSEDPSAADEVAPYEPDPEDVYVNAKRLGGRVAQGLVTYAAGEALEDIVRRAATAPAPDLNGAGVAAKATPLFDPEATSAGEVVYAQLGGLHPAAAPTAASVMVVVEQRRVTDDGDQIDHTRTVDVRLRLVDGDWRFDDLGDVGGAPVEAPPDLSDAARAVLDDERIDLPDSARWDIHRGDIDDRLLLTMREMAEIASYRVCCLKSGHPINVFGSSTVSNHAEGRGVDVWEVDGQPVVRQQPQPDSAAHAFTRAIFDAGIVPELGGPWAFDPPGGRSFENDVHRDHIHVAFHR